MNIKLKTLRYFRQSNVSMLTVFICRFFCMSMIFIVTLQGVIASSDTTFQKARLDYDIVYVRYPPRTEKSPFVRIPQGEHPYVITPGADLMLLRKNGSEEILVDCDECSVMDPFISYDGKTVYYSLIVGPDFSSASWIYKLDLVDKNATPIRLTFNDGFDSYMYQGNRDKPEGHDQSAYREIRDMAPVPLADGRLLFTSNRSALTMFNPGTNAVVKGSIQQLYVMQDHDGSLNSTSLANITRLEAGTLHLAQHPFQLKDGRILFSSWQDVGIKFTYAMTNLMTVHPDGTNLQQFTEPHDHHKLVEHFITQLSDEQVVSALYYPSFDYGYGIFMRYPIDPPGADFLRGAIDQTTVNGGRISYREFDRKGAKSITPHTTPLDQPAPNLSGKYSMPSATKNDGLLMAYSTGSVNHFGAVCRKANACQALQSGIYLKENATNDLISSPNQLLLVKNDPAYNEIWPRAVLPYSEIYGQEKPDVLPSVEFNGPEDQRIKIGEAAALVGSASTYNRDVFDRGDIFQSNRRRETHDGNWTIQGAVAGEFTNTDIYGIRIVTTPSKPYTQPISKYDQDKSKWQKVSGYLLDQRLKRVVSRHGSVHGERWEILGEFPLTNKGIMDKQGNPDTSWLAKVPAETPFLIQAIDKNGMTLISEMTWRALKAGEKRADCGGCHAHAIPALDFASTQAGKAAPIHKVEGISNKDSRIDLGFWDLTQGSIPVLSGSGGVEFIKNTAVGVEFNRDVLPIINNKCVSCHTEKGTGRALILDGSDGKSPYVAINSNRIFNGKSLISPQKSKYIRALQARQSLMVWVVYGQRLDGRTNETRLNDIDYPEHHPKLNLSVQEKKMFARWIDLGGAINFPETNGFGYTDDYQLPVINISQPIIDNNAVGFDIGFYDMGSGIDRGKIEAEIFEMESEPATVLTTLQRFIPFVELGPKTHKLSGNLKDSVKNIYHFNIPPRLIVSGRKYVLKVKAYDRVGNMNVSTKHFILNKL